MMAACSDSTGPAAKVDPVGTYKLQTINGQPLPILLADLFNGAYRLQQTDGRMTLFANRTFLEQDMVRETFQQDVGEIVHDTTINFTGTWEAEDSVITLNVKEDGSVLFGVSRKVNLTLTWVKSDSSYTFIYTRN